MINQRAAELMVMGRDLPWLLSQWVERTPDKTFLIWAPTDEEHRTWTYREFDTAVRRLATGLQKQGLQLGQRLLIHMENCPELLIAHFACAYLGVVAVLTNSRAATPELKHYCELSEAVAAITQPRFLTQLREAGPQLRFISVDITELQDNPPFAAERKPDPLLDLRVQFTSGTTSRPKGVLTTHANTLFAAQQTANAYYLTGEDICQVVVPLFHNNGLVTLVMSTLWAGGTVLLQRKFSASNFWEPALQYKATWTSLPGSFFLQALSELPVPDHYFRFWIVAVLPEVETHYKVKTRGHWGMTEMITLPLVGDARHQGPQLSLGRPAPGNEIAIRRPDGSDCGPGETGALFVRGVRGITLFKEYLNNPEANAKSFDAEGWFSTGDRIRIDEQGNLFFADRDKDMLRVGGENVAASEIEVVIRKSGWVKECAVVGQKHRMLDEVPVAFVTPAEGAPSPLKDPLIRHCQQHLADFKVIREVYIVDEFPRATLEKIAKHKLREGLPALE